MTPAPFFDDIVPQTFGAQAYWVETEDGLRLRVGHWAAQEQTSGTVLIFPGRTEYIEKYVNVAADLADAGFDSLVIDWRGQGLGQRMLPDALTGHVNNFKDYQHDVNAMLEAARALNLAEPFYVLGHSMGGCIGLRALYEGLPVEAAAFSAPMWGIRMANAVLPAAWAVSWTTKFIGLGHMYAPSTGAESYVATAEFEDNLLTRDRESFEWLRTQVLSHPELQLGGPSLRWLHEALVETRTLASRSAPSVPCFTLLGDNERIVSCQRVKHRMESWPESKLAIIENGEHELLMEAEPMRKSLVGDIVAHFNGSRMAAKGSTSLHA